MVRFVLRCATVCTTVFVILVYYVYQGGFYTWSLTDRLCWLLLALGDIVLLLTAWYVTREVGE